MQADKASIILRIAGEHPRLPFTTAFATARSFEKRPVHLLVALYAAGVLWLAGFVHLAETPVHATSLPLLSSEPPAPTGYEDALWAVLRAWGGVGGYVSVAEEQPKSRVGQGVCVVAMWVGSVWSGLVVVALLRMTALHSRDEVVRHKLDRYGKVLLATPACGGSLSRHGAMQPVAPERITFLWKGASGGASSADWILWGMRGS